MDDLFNDLKIFIDERIDTDIKVLERKEDYKNSYKNYEDLYKNLSYSLNKNQKMALKNLTDTLIDIYIQHRYITYQTGFIDGMKLRRE